jgi:hypothetical protein
MVRRSARSNMPIAAVETISRSCGSSFISWMKPWPLFGAEQALGRQLDVLEEQLRGVGPVHAELVQLAAAAKARRVVGLDHHQRGALGALRGIGLRDDPMIRLACWPLVMKVFEPFST